MVALSAGIAALLLLIGIIRPRWLLLTFIFLAPIVPVNLGYSLLGERGMTISPVRLVAVCLAVGIGIRVLLGKIPLRFPLAVPFALYLGVRVAGLLLAPDKTGGAILLAGEFGALTAVLSYGAFCLIRRPSDFDRLVTVAIIAAIIAGAIGIWEWQTDRFFAATPLVRQFSAVPVTSETIAMKTEGLKRITGPFAHSLTMAGFMAFLIPICMQRAGMRRRSSRVFHYAALAVMMTALLLTFGRAALAITVAEVLAVLKFSHRRKVWPIALAIVGAAIVMVPVYAHYRSPGEETSLLVPKAQMMTFVHRYRHLAGDFMSYPPATLLGFGLGRNDMTGVAPHGEESWFWGAVDRDFEKVLGTAGIAGLATWLVLFLAYAWYVRRSAVARRRIVWETSAGAVAVGLVGAVLLAIPGVSILTYSQTLPIVGIFMGAGMRILWEDRSRAAHAVSAERDRAGRAVGTPAGRGNLNRVIGCPSPG